VRRDPERTLTEPFRFPPLMLGLAFRDQNKDRASLDRAGSQEWTILGVIYGSALHRFGSGERDVLRGP
jgi:hypothetical protein